MEVYNINCYWTKRAELKETSLWTITCMKLSNINCYRTERNQFVSHYLCGAVGHQLLQDCESRTEGNQFVNHYLYGAVRHQLLQDWRKPVCEPYLCGAVRHQLLQNYKSRTEGNQLWTITCMKMDDINCYTTYRSMRRKVCEPSPDCYRTAKAGLKETACKPVPEFCSLLSA